MLPQLRPTPILIGNRPFPILPSNGRRRWTAATELADLIVVDITGQG